MAPRRKDPQEPRAFGTTARSSGGPSGKGAGAPKPQGRRREPAQAIPDAVASRMARRIAIATGIPTLLGMAVFVASYVLVSRHLLAIPPVATLIVSGACFLLGLLGLSYGVLSTSWEGAPGTLLGFEQIVLNVGRLRESVRAMRSGGTPQA